MNKVYSVFVGGVEVHDYLVDLRTANKIMKSWLDKGYDDVGITKYFKEENSKLQKLNKGVK